MKNDLRYQEDYIYIDPTSLKATPLSNEEIEWIDNNKIGDINHAPLDSLHNLLPRLDSKAKDDTSGDYDYCMVLPSDESSYSVRYEGLLILNQLTALDLEIRIIQEDLTDDKQQNDKNFYVLIRAPLELLRKVAKEYKFKMLCDPEQLRKCSDRIGLYINDGEDYCSYNPYESIYLKYTDEIPEKLYWRPKGMTHPFRSSIRLRLLSLIIENGLKERGVYEDIQDESKNVESARIKKQILDGKILAFFPLHNRKISDKLLRHWTYMYAPPWRLPFFQIKEYFGEKIALFTCLTSHFTTWLIIPAIIGIPLQLIIILNNWDYSSKSLPAYAFFICVWAIIMLEYWKRREFSLQLAWGTSDLELLDVVRPEFIGTEIRSYVDGSKYIYFPPSDHRCLVLQSTLAITAIILLLLGLVVGIYVARYNLYDHIGGSNAQILASVMNSTLIAIANPLYYSFAIYLTGLENQRTDAAFYNAMVAKLFVFQFINSYASFFYLGFVAAYVKPPSGTPSDYLGDCGFSNCMRPLSINLIFVFLVRLIVGNLTTLLLPYLSYQYRLFHGYIQGHSPHIDYQPAVEFLLDAYDADENILKDTCDLVIQFGYITLFISALPIATCFVFINNIFEIKGDAWSLITLYQRPVPVPAQNIGVWQDIFTIISVVAVVTNAGITVLTMNVLNSYRSSGGGFWFFTTFQWCGFLVQIIAMAYIDDIPEDVVIQKRRQKYLSQQIFNDKLSHDKTFLSEMINYQSTSEDESVLKENDTISLENTDSLDHLMDDDDADDDDGKNNEAAENTPLISNRF